MLLLLTDQYISSFTLLVNQNLLITFLSENNLKIVKLIICHLSFIKSLCILLSTLIGGSNFKMALKNIYIFRHTKAFV